MVSDQVKKFFPHKQIREGQEELVTDTEVAFKEKKILLAHAPTGLGKTASALSVAIQAALENKKTVFFLTNRHTQHRIAIDTLKLIEEKTDQKVTVVDLIGKRWMCSQSIAGLFGNDFNEFCKNIVEKGECEFFNNVKSKKGLTVEAQALIKDLQKKPPLHNEELISFSVEKKMCSYEIALALAKKTNVIIGDYYYLFNPFVQNTLFTKLGLTLEDVILVVDEGHNLPSRVTEMMSSNLTTFMIKNAISEAKKFGYKGLIIWLQDLMQVLTKLAEFEDRKEKLVNKDDFINQVKKIHDYEELINEFELAADEIRKKQRKSYVGGIASFLEFWQGEDEGFARMITEVMTKYGDQIVLSYSCLDPALVTADIFSQVDAGVIMSGTLKPVFMYKDLLGIKKAMEKEYSSPFPPENKLSLVVPETTTKFTLRGEKMYKEIAARCNKFSSLIPGNVALFFPSYRLRDSVGEFFRSDKKHFWEKSEMNKEEKDQFLTQFKDAKEQGGVLLGVTGANFAEGVDLPGDLLNGVVVIGLPLAKPNLKTQQIIAYYEKKFNKGWDYGYTYPAMSKCVQSAGRCIRSGTDKGTVIYLDERFSWQRYYDCLPREGLIVTKEYEKFLSEFFR